jgi:hypothetical protein
LPPAISFKDGSLSLDLPFADLDVYATEVFDYGLTETDMANSGSATCRYTETALQGFDFVGATPDAFAFA